MGISLVPEEESRYFGRSWSGWVIKWYMEESKLLMETTAPFKEVNDSPGYINLDIASVKNNS